MGWRHVGEDGRYRQLFSRIHNGMDKIGILANFQDKIHAVIFGRGAELLDVQFVLPRKL